MKTSIPTKQSAGAAIAQSSAVIQGWVIQALCKAGSLEWRTLDGWVDGWREAKPGLTSQGAVLSIGGCAIIRRDQRGTLIINPISSHDCSSCSSSRGEGRKPLTMYMSQGWESQGRGRRRHKTASHLDPSWLANHAVHGFKS